MLVCQYTSMPIYTSMPVLCDAKVDEKSAANDGQQAFAQELDNQMRLLRAQVCSFGCTPIFAFPMPLHSQILWRPMDPVDPI